MIQSGITTNYIRFSKSTYAMTEKEKINTEYKIDAKISRYSFSCNPVIYLHHLSSGYRFERKLFHCQY